MDFDEIRHLFFFRKPVEEVQISLKSDKNNGYLHEDGCAFMISRWFILKMKSVSDNIVEIIRTHISNSTAFSESRAVFWDNMEEYDGAKQATYANIIRYMRLAYWITKATHTHTHTAMVSQTHVSITLYVHCVSC